ncbi:MAG: GNAT family N-acetyltransferase [Armatimonadetes bacterium]|nr:GNAT family N-acetyltransferase [Armatimonadota bacterium]
MAHGWEGEKVRLVPLDKEKHLQNALAWLNDPEVTRWLLMGDFPLAQLEEEQFFEKMTGKNREHAMFAIETLNAEHIGFTGIHAIDWRQGIAGTGTVIGRKDLWGKGYGTDAARIRTRYAFDVLGLLTKVDRYDVNGPSSNVGNSLGSRLVNAAVQLDCYQKVFWCTANLSRGLVGDGGVSNGGSSADKSDDWTPLFNFVDQGLNNKGIYFSGDDLAFDWITLAGAAIQFRTTYMDFALAGSSPGDHVASGEPISPCLVAVSPNFTHLGAPDSLIAYGGCPAINDFDLLNPLQGQAEFVNPSSGRAYIISQTTENAVGDTSRVILSGFSYHTIRSKRPGFPDARTEHLADIISFLQNALPNPTAVPDEPVVGRNVLMVNYPNPFNPTTTIRYNVRERGHVTLSVYNVAGQRVRTLVDDVRDPVQGGLHTVVWHGDSEAGQEVASGVYFYKLVTPGFTKTRKMVLLK